MNNPFFAYFNKNNQIRRLLPVYFNKNKELFHLHKWVVF